MPDVLSWLAGKGLEDLGHTCRLWGFVGSAAALIYVEHRVIAMVVG